MSAQVTASVLLHLLPGTGRIRGKRRRFMYRRYRRRSRVKYAVRSVMIPPFVQLVRADDGILAGGHLKQKKSSFLESQTACMPSILYTRIIVFSSKSAVHSVSKPRMCKLSEYVLGSCKDGLNLLLLRLLLKEGGRQVIRQLLSLEAGGK